MKEENGKKERNATEKYGSAENNVQYPSDVDKLKAGIEEINPAMPSRWNAWVVEEGQGADHLEMLARGCSIDDKNHQMIWSCSLLKLISRHALGFPYGDQIRKISTSQNRRKVLFCTVKTKKNG